MRKQEIPLEVVEKGGPAGGKRPLARAKPREEDWRPPYENILANIKPDPAYVAVASALLEKEAERLPEKLRERVIARRDVAEPVTGDTFYALYSYYPLLKKSEEIANEILRGMRDAFAEWMSSDRYKSIRSITRLDRAAATAFTLRFAAVFLKKLAEKIPPEEWPITITDGPPGSGGDVVVKGNRDDGEEDGPQGPTDGPGSPGGGKPQEGGVDGQEIARAAREAAEEALEEAEKAARAASELGGLSKGTDPAELAFIDEDLGVSRVEFETIIEVLGEIRKRMPLLFAKGKKAAKRGEPSGYRTTRKPEEALPRELALPEELFLAKLAGGSLLARDYRVLTRGVMIVLLDRSGSMDEGRKMAWAKAVALALAAKAIREDLDYVLIPFDARPHEPMTLDVVKDILRIRADGGTSIARALRRALDLAEEKGYRKANIIVITDGIDNLSQDTIRELAERARRLRATVKVAYIQGDNEALRKLAVETGGELMTVEPGASDAVLVVKKA